MNDEFVTIPGYPRYSINQAGVIVNDRGYEKAQQLNKDGYLKLNLYRNGKQTTKRVHRLVAEVFVPNPDNKSDVNHKDGNKLNCSSDNLEWTTKSENMLHAYATGLNPRHVSRGMLGHKNPNAGRKRRSVRVIETGDVFPSIAICANKLGFDERRIYECIKGTRSEYRGYHFELYEE